MSSREIADLTGKQHAHVMRDIRIMLDELWGNDGQSRFGSSYLNAQNKPQPCYNLPKHETMVLLTGYSVTLRSRILARWQELEAGAAPAPKPATREQQIANALLLSQEIIAEKDEQIAVY